MKENKALAGKLNKVAIALTVVVLLLVGAMRRYKIPTDVDFTFLPQVNAILNTVVAILLVIALIFIKKKKVDHHRKAIFAAMFFSALFLLCYVLYHFTTVETTYCKDDWTRSLYYFFLATHIILAAVSFPFILFTFIRGFTWQVEKHKKMARWVWPMWFYVAITGPIVYLMLSPCY